jgi:hypothetical protein
MDADDSASCKCGNCGKTIPLHTGPKIPGLNFLKGKLASVQELKFQEEYIWKSVQEIIDNIHNSTNIGSARGQVDPLFKAMNKYLDFKGPYLQNVIKAEKRQEFKGSESANKVAKEAAAAVKNKP